MVVEERSFRLAAKRLGVSPSALSRAIRALEDRLAVRLLNRTTRSVAPTEAGQTLYARVAPTMRELDSAMRDANDAAGHPSGAVRINLPSIAAKLVIGPRLGAFAAAFPAIRIDLEVNDGIVDVVAGGFDLGVRIGSQVAKDMIAARLSPDLRMAVVGSPKYFAQYPRPASPNELTAHRCVTYKWAQTGGVMAWHFDVHGERSTVAVTNVMTANDTDMLLSAALQGVGLAFLAETLVIPYLETGALERVLEDWCQPMAGFHLYYPSRTNMPAAVRAFIDFMKIGNV